MRIAKSQINAFWNSVYSVLGRYFILW